MDPRRRYPPGIGNGRGGVSAGGNPNFYARNPLQQQQQQYVQRNPQQGQQNLQFQHQQQQQWLRRTQMGGDSRASETASINIRLGGLMRTFPHRLTSAKGKKLWPQMHERWIQVGTLNKARAR